MNASEPLLFDVEADPASGWLVAAWNAPLGQGGITTQAPDLERLIAAIKEAVACHFDEGDARLACRIQLRFADNPVLAAS
ncbi:MAG: 2-oxoisovalerate dehydrogenase [Verrucomicrobia bacterium]|nr:2-oxoisovalerate dehydrogenase [Verrucomicrobiota bacterium]